MGSIRERESKQQRSIIITDPVKSNLVAVSTEEPERVKPNPKIKIVTADVIFFKCQHTQQIIVNTGLLHSNTKISRANIIIEDQLTSDLDDVVEALQEEVDSKTKQYCLLSRGFYFRIKPKLTVLVYDLLREVASKSYN